MTARITISIKPSNTSNERRERLRAWIHEVEELTHQNFKEIMQKVSSSYQYSLQAGDLMTFKVKEVMGIGPIDQKTSSAKSTFSQDVLIIEICGPNEEHFSIIDVPGIFRNKTPGVTTDQDIAMVRQMVIKYMKNERSVIMAIVPANADIATQEIVELAGECDKSGDRTIGVLTKPDLVDDGAEKAVIDLLLGDSYPLRLGWFVVKNPGQKALEQSNVDHMEKERSFFETETP